MAAWLIRSKLHDTSLQSQIGAHIRNREAFGCFRVAVQLDTLLQALSLLPETAFRDSNRLADNDAKSAADPRTRRCLLRLGVRADAAGLGTTAAAPRQERGALAQAMNVLAFISIA